MQSLVQGISHNGEGVCRIDGKACFVPFVIPGESIELEKTEEKKNFSRGRLLKLIESSDDRIDPACPYFEQCGGCAYQHMNYQRELRLKQDIVKQSLKRIGRIDTEVNPALEMNEPWAYRNKVTWHIKREKERYIMGYYQNNSNHLLDIVICPLLSPQMQELSLYLRKHLEELNLPDKCEIIIRQSSTTGQLMLVFLKAQAKRIKLDELAGYEGLSSIFCVENDKVIKLYGNDCLVEKIMGITYEISPLAFFQVNPIQTIKLYQQVYKYLDIQKEDSILDAFCGTGSISLQLASYARRVVGIEDYNEAVIDARHNADLNQINNCEFISGACEKVIPELDEQFDLLVLDPPRAGCKPEALEAIKKINPCRIVYVSCNPATLARDLKILLEGPYMLEEVQPVDMFPRTHHVECVVLLYRE